MTKSDIQAALENVPGELKDAGPLELKAHFELIEGITPDEVNSLTALYLVRTLPGNEPLLDSMKALSMIKHRIKSKYSVLGGSPDHELWPYIEIAAIALTRNKLAIVF